MNLRPYQIECLEKFANQRHVLCGDEMGVGKTVEAIALDQLRRMQAGPGDHKTLVIAPLTGVIDSWVEHFEEWTDLKVRRIDHRSAKHRARFLEVESDVYVIHPEGLRLEENRLIQVDWLHVIFDEVHRAKNRKTQTFKAAQHVGKKAQYRSGFTGTPVMNHPDELWAILNWLYPTKKDRDSAGFKHWYQKLLNSYWRFYERFIEYDEDPVYGYRTITGTKNEDELRSLIDPFYIRRLKRDVLSHLPPKQYQKYEVELHPKQRRAYNDMKKELIAWIGEQENQPLVASIAIAKLIRLQQFTLGHAQIINGEMKLSDPSAKLDALMDILDDLGETQCVVFSTSKQAINLAEGRLVKAGYTTAKVTGDVGQTQRTGAIKRFQSGEAQVFLATIGAGGVGLNLQNANTVIFLDRDWSPANNLQAEDRVHRSGQEHDSVHIIDIIARDTVDQQKDRKLQQKWGWIKATVGA